MNAAHHKILSEWAKREQSACRDWHVSEYRTAHDEREIKTKMREFDLGCVFLVALAAYIILWVLLP